MPCNGYLASSANFGGIGTEETCSSAVQGDFVPALILDLTDSEQSNGDLDSSQFPPRQHLGATRFAFEEHMDAAPFWPTIPCDNVSTAQAVPLGTVIDQNYAKSGDEHSDIFTALLIEGVPLSKQKTALNVLESNDDLLVEFVALSQVVSECHAQIGCLSKHLSSANKFIKRVLALDKSTFVSDQTQKVYDAASEKQSRKLFAALVLFRESKYSKWCSASPQVKLEDGTFAANTIEAKQR